MIAAACQMGLEGIIGKRRDALQRPHAARGSNSNAASGRNSSSAAIPIRKARAAVSARCCWVLTTKDGKLQYAGNVGSGFNAASLRDLKAENGQAACRTKARSRPAARSTRKPTGSSPRWWPKCVSANGPILARSVTPCSRTAQGQEGAAGITSEKPVHIKEEQPAMQSALASMKVTNPDRVIDKQSGATKIALIRYYALVADLMIRT
jgi:bifunctional non-homologous end joining protein LigD